MLFSAAHGSIGKVTNLGGDEKGQSANGKQEQDD
mgnify:CR=1 FL=1